MQKARKVRKTTFIKFLIKKYGWLFHVLFGIATVFACKISVILPLIMFLTFVLYEYDEQTYLGDNAIEELREYGTGLFIGVLLMILL